jgi:hypothetical protein
VNTLPASLVRYQQALEDAIRNDLDHGRRRSRTRRLLVAGATASALALAVLAIVSTRGPSGVQTASAASVIHRATAALAQTPGMILHVSMTATQTNPGGGTVSWSDESWQQVDAPYARRQIETGLNGKTESASGAQGDAVYDRARNTIYVFPAQDRVTAPERPSYRLAPGRRPGSYVIRLQGPAPSAGGVRVRPLTISAAQAKALRKGTDVVVWRFHVAPAKCGATSARQCQADRATYVTPAVISASRLPRPSHSALDSAPEPDPDSPAFRDQILALLRSGGAAVLGHVTVDGRDTIEIASADGHTIYYVDADTYAPVELDTTGTDGGVMLRFDVYEEIPTEGNTGLLNLTDQHPTATVDRDPADYRAAEERLFPHG